MEKYQKIASDIEAQINRGKLVAGDKLPSLRNLLRTYDCSKATVSRGMEALKARGLIYAKERSGYFVLGKLPEPEPFICQTFDFSSKGVNRRDFPYEEFQRCLTLAMSQYQEELAYYGHPKGVPVLVTTLVTLLQQYGVYTSEEALYISSGIQEALYVLTQLTFPNQGETILVETPTYDTYLRTLRLLGKSVAYVERTLEGLDIKAVESYFKTGRIKFFYLMPRLHNPLGTNLSKATMLKLVDLAEKYDVYLVEDDYLADYHRGQNNLPLHYYTKERVIYLKSFSKIIFPGIRIGAVVLPAKLREGFEAYKLILNISTDSMAQIAMATYISNGMYEKNRQRLVEKLVKRGQILEESLNHSLEEMGPFKVAGIHCSLTFPKEVSKATLIAELARGAIEVDSLEGSFLEEPSQQLIKLNVTNIEEGTIFQGIQRLSDLLNRHIKRL